MQREYITIPEAEFFEDEFADSDYLDRPGAYGIIWNDDGQIAAVEVENCLFLPGGGLDAGESPQQALLRELIEELGWVATIGRRVGIASYCFHSAREDTSYRKIGHFFTATCSERHSERGEASHMVRWLSSQEAMKLLYEPNQRWAIEQAAQLEEYDMAFDDSANQSNEETDHSRERGTKGSA